MSEEIEEEHPEEETIMVHRDIAINLLNGHLIEMYQWTMPDGPHQKITISIDQVSSLIEALESISKP